LLVLIKQKYGVNSRKVITSKNLTMLMGLIDQEIEEINAKKRKRSGHPAGGQPELKDDDGQLRANTVKARDAELRRSSRRRPPRAAMPVVAHLACR
jgi:hypothetical protein